MISRRRFIAAAAAAASAAAIPVEALAGEAIQQSGSKKKGLGLGPKNIIWPDVLTNLQCKWCYTWMGAVPPDMPRGVEFIPMVRSRFADAEKITDIAAEAKAHGITELLGLNEPDAKKQDDMSVEAALDMWPMLMETGMRLGSPGCVHPDNEWMTAFMDGVEKRKLRVDFVCIHSYGSPDPLALTKRLDRIQRLYKRPLWITEFAVGDWNAKTVEENKHSARDVLRFMDRVLPMLDRLNISGVTHGSRQDKTTAPSGPAHYLIWMEYSHHSANATATPDNSMITRRKFITLSATSAAALSLAACQRQPEPAKEIVPPGSRKKGLGQSVKNPEWAARLSDLDCKWFYSWGPKVPEGIPKGVEFIPMIYRYGGDTQAIIDTTAAAKKAGITELLGFNEPDVAKQGNMTIEETLDAWPLLMETGMRLGSPGCVHPDKEWMIEFMAGVEKRNLRVDFVCVHSYGGPSPEALVRRLEKVHQMFGRPLWITEFAVGDWEAKSVETNRHKPETVLRFMEGVLPMLDKLDFVERYAWFPAKTTSIPLGTSALFDADGSLTPLGECYRDA